MGAAMSAAGDAAMMACPRWQKCSANICPLDPDWRDRSHAPGEPVCGLAQEAVKPGANERLAQYVRTEVLAEVRRVLPEITSRWYVIRRAVERAATTGSRLDRLPLRAHVGVMLEGAAQMERPVALDDAPASDFDSNSRSDSNHDPARGAT
jgi:hypothetical protein